MCAARFNRRDTAPAATLNRRQHAYSRKGNGTTIMLMVDGEGTPLSAFITDDAASEVQSIEPLVDERLTRRKPKRLSAGCTTFVG